MLTFDHAQCLCAFLANSPEWRMEHFPHECWARHSHHCSKHDETGHRPSNHDTMNSEQPTTQNASMESLPPFTDERLGSNAALQSSGSGFTSSFRNFFNRSERSIDTSTTSSSVNPRGRLSWKLQTSSNFNMDTSIQEEGSEYKPPEDEALKQLELQDNFILAAMDRKKKNESPRGRMLGMFTSRSS